MSSILRISDGFSAEFLGSFSHSQKVNRAFSGSTQCRRRTRWAAMGGRQGMLGRGRPSIRSERGPLRASTSWTRSGSSSPSLYTQPLVARRATPRSCRRRSLRCSVGRRPWMPSPPVMASATERARLLAQRHIAKRQTRRVRTRLRRELQPPAHSSGSS